jgi:hypothetical protein
VVHQAELVADVVDRVDDVVELCETELVDAASGDQVVDGVAAAFRVDGEDAFTQDIDLDAADGVFECMDLAVGVADIDVVVVDQRDLADAGACAGLGRPRANTADADDTEMRARKRWQRSLTEYPADTGESIFIGLG